MAYTVFGNTNSIYRPTRWRPNAPNLMHSLPSKHATNDQIADRLKPILGHLAQNLKHQTNSAQAFEQWQITPVSGGMNNLIYQISGPDDHFAVKFLIKDERFRAKREYYGLLAVQQAGLDLAPKPILLDDDSYRQPVVVQQWVEGERLDAIPANDLEWTNLIDHFLSIHSIKQTKANAHLPSAVINCNDITAGFALVGQHLAMIPATERPASLTTLVDRFRKTSYPTWPAITEVLCRVDANTLNFIKTKSGWKSVDWENCGWGDPAFEVADILTHPAYEAMSQSRWQWLIDAYCQKSTDPTMAQRIQVYLTVMLVWWVVRLVRYKVEIPSGQDQRLTQTLQNQAEWATKRNAQYQHYLDLAWEIGGRDWGW